MGFLGLYWLITACLLQNLSAATLTANFQRNPINLGESATLELRFEGGAPLRPPDVVPVGQLTIGGIGQSQQFSFVNGVRQHTVVYSYPITPSQAGDFQLGVIRADVNGQTLAVQPPVLKVLATAPQTQADNDARQFAFIQFPLPKKEVFVGESFPVQVELYVKYDAAGNAPGLSSQGFTFGPLIQIDKRPVQANNSVYQRLTYQILVRAGRPGDLILGPAECNLTLRIPTGRRDPFDLFGQRVVEKPMALASELHPVRVLPLPADNMPEDFAGAVGNFTAFNVEAGPTTLTVGDPITLKVKIAGRGALDALKFDAPNHWREFKTYPPTASVKHLDALNWQGEKSIEQVVVPENAEVKELPAMSFSFFDPDARAYRTLTQPAIPLTVRPGVAAPALPTVVATTNQNATAAQTPRDIIHIKPRLGAMATSSVPWVTRPGFWLLNLVPVVAWLAALLWRKQRDELTNNPRRRRAREVEKIIARGLDELREQARIGDAPAFFATTFRLLQERLGERLDLPAAAITESVIDEQLRPLKVEESTLIELHELFQACNQARYAAGADTRELGTLREKVSRVLGAASTIKAKP